MRENLCRFPQHTRIVRLVGDARWLTNCTGRWDLTSARRAAQGAAALIRHDRPPAGRGFLVAVGKCLRRVVCLVVKCDLGLPYFVGESKMPVRVLFRRPLQRPCSHPPEYSQAIRRSWPSRLSLPRHLPFAHCEIWVSSSSNAIRFTWWVEGTKRRAQLLARCAAVWKQCGIMAISMVDRTVALAIGNLIAWVMPSGTDEFPA